MLIGNLTKCNIKIFCNICRSTKDVLYYKYITTYLDGCQIILWKIIYFDNILKKKTYIKKHCRKGNSRNTPISVFHLAVNHLSAQLRPLHCFYCTVFTPVLKQEISTGDRFLATQPSSTHSSFNSCSEAFWFSSESLKQTQNIWVECHNSRAYINEKPQRLPANPAPHVTSVAVAAGLWMPCISI